ncbi:winged helix-turn-helix domain-containing protein [Candidatus Bathyarchaeota archaeon]|jgi:uncharacterized protein|nr:winged helix-turn-helix domain-containing protein [Candidatus Bathyarchaeota archaeon]
MEISRESARRLMIEKQGITQFPESNNKKSVVDTINHLGCLQIDTISVIERAHYLTLWSRLGSYDKNYLDESAYKDKKLFEYWAHAACFVSYDHYRFYLHAMKVREEEMKVRFVKRTGKDVEVLDQVLARIKNEGPLCSKDFEGPKKKGGWWNRKTEKVAMDYMYGAGILMVSDRVSFQRYYDLSENVLPSWVDVEPPSYDERIEFFIRKTLKSLGAIKPIDVRKYFHHHSVKLGQTTKQIEERLKGLDGVRRFKVEGDKNTHYSLDEDIERLDTLDGDFSFNDVRLLVYFDNMMWNRERVQHLFGFESKLEIYLPQDQRVYGYYHLPVLYGDQLVARIEPKMDRKEKKLIIRGYWTEPGFNETEEYTEKLERNLSTFAAFHKADEIEWLG